MIVAHLYLEQGEEAPKGYKVKTYSLFPKSYQTLEQYMMNDNVNIILNQDIKPAERRGTVPEEGWVWAGDD